MKASTTTTIDASPNSLKDSNVNLKVKTMKERIGVCSLVCNVSKVGGAY
jgi:hypothetical protein